MEKVYKTIEGYKKEIIELTKKLIAIPTVNPPGKNYEKIVEVLESQFKLLGMKTARYEVPKDILKKHKIDASYPRINLVAMMNNKKKRTLHFNGHYDVVPANKEWKEAFNPKVVGDNLYGRGGFDMKSGFASYIYAIKALKDNNIIPNVNIEVSCVADEETGGALGTGFLVKNKIINPDYAVGEGAMKNMLGIGNKGVMFIEIEVIGKASHGAYPLRGVNSFEKMNLLVKELLKLKEEVQARKTKYPTEKKEDQIATFVIGGKLEGGNKINTVPQKTIFSIDRRVLPEETIEKAKKEIIEVVESFMKKNKDVKINIDFKQSDSPVIVEPKSYFCKKFIESAEKFAGKIKPRIASGGTDLRYLIRKGTPSLGYNASGKNMHADNEFVSISSLINTTKIFSDLILNLE